MSTFFFSIIVPIYNGATLLGETIDSVLNQSFHDWEMIAVDDHSTDNSAQLLKDAGTRHPNINVIIHEKNHGGPFAARNTALDHAKGEYLIFLDQDDLLAADSLEKIAQLAKECQSDAIRGVRISLKDGKEKIMNEFLPASPVSTRFQDSPELWPGNNFAAWIFKREFISENGLRFQDLIGHDDKEFLLHALLSARSLTVSDIPLVKYRRRHNSLQGRKNPRSMFDDIRAHGMMLTLLHETGNKRALDHRFKRLDFPAIAGMCAWASTQVDKETRKDFYEKAQQIFNRPEVRDLDPGEGERPLIFSSLKAGDHAASTRLLRKYSHRLRRYPWWRTLWNRGTAAAKGRE
ncbi:glycosyltransferase family 2 protein [Desulfovibrio sp. Fe33]|uniref:glycosyltransferase family 2 protein n=1 Tax=Desulfovibrio sp. Fe33 TaxID=3020842 RepID=UPI00234DEB83|nr:glycosyltransferase family 2 protein [Desulfovibrio sp. Fe33]